MYIHTYASGPISQSFCNYNPEGHSTGKQGAALYVQYVCEVLLPLLTRKAQFHLATACYFMYSHHRRL